MRMNPIMIKDLKRDTRSWKLPIALLFYNGILVFIFTVFMNFIEQMNTNNYYYSTRNFNSLITLFPYIVVAQFIVVGFMIPIMTSGSISGEREKQTLDILLTTPIKTSKIIRGKMLSSICKVLIFVISSIPILSLSFMVGGLSWWALVEFIFCMIIISIHLASIGVFCSALIKKSIGATIVAFVIIGAIYVGSIIFITIIAATTNSLSDVDYLVAFLVNPATMVFELISKNIFYYGISDTLRSGTNGILANIIGTIGWNNCAAIVSLLESCLFMSLAKRVLEAKTKK